MFRQFYPSKVIGLLMVCCCLIEVVISSAVQLNPTVVFAHEVEVDGDVAATFHLEPNHNPRAGESARVWFALTRKGGQLIPLEECNCQLSVYSQPHAEGDQPLMQPPLLAVSAEQYKGIPGATIVFPKAGIYELELRGKAKTGTSFQPFKLSYSVTVR